MGLALSLIKKIRARIVRICFIYKFHVFKYVSYIFGFNFSDKSNRNCYDILFTTLLWSGNSKRTFWSSS